MSYIGSIVTAVACSDVGHFRDHKKTRRHGKAVWTDKARLLPDIDDTRPATARLSSIYKGIATLREKPHTHSLDRAREMIERVKAVKLRMT